MKIWVEVPNGWKEPIKKAMQIRGWEKRTDYIREVLKEDLEALGLLGVRKKNGNKNGEAVMVEVDA